MTKILEPSLLAFDHNPIKQLEEAKSLGIKCIHFDIMDGKFVELKSYFDQTIINTISDMGFQINVHVMGFDFMQYAKLYGQYNIFSLTFQLEAAYQSNTIDELRQAINYLKSKGIKSGIAINPYTTINQYENFLTICDIVTIMTVQAGKGGQKFNPDGLINLNHLYDYKKTKNPNLLIEIDGGINNDNFSLFIDKVNYVVSGSSFIKYSYEEKTKMIKNIQSYPISK